MLPQSVIKYDSARLFEDVFASALIHKSRRLKLLCASALIAIPSPTFAQSVSASGDIRPSTIQTPNWTVNGRLDVGRDSVGQLSITGGGTVTAGEIVAGGNNAGIGHIEVTGQDSLLKSLDYLTIGTSGNGYMTIADEARVTSLDAYVGDYSTGSGFVSVDGLGTNWTSRHLHLGPEGIGTLQVSGGATVSSTWATMGWWSSGGTGSAIVAGERSSWSAFEGFYIGIRGSGTLTVQDNGKIISSDTLQTVNVATDSSSKGLINIGASATGPARRPGTIEANEIKIGEGEGRIVFNHTEVDGYEFLPVITGKGTVSHLAGTTVLAGSNTSGRSFRGHLAVEGGSLAIDGTFGDVDNNTATAIARDGGVIGGSGTFAGSIAVEGGTLVNAGQSALNIRRDLSLQSDSRVDVGLDSASLSPKFIVGGDLRLDGTLNVSDLGRFDAGVHRLFDYSGILSDYGLEIGTTPAGVSRNDLFVQTSNAGQVSLLSSAGVDLTFWDGSAPALHDDGSIHGGAGVWNATNRGWTSSDGALNGPYRGQSFAIFGGTAGGRVMIDDTAGEIVTGGMQFLTNGYELAGDGLRLDGAAQRTVIRVGDGSIGSDAINATITSSLSGASSLVKSDDGVLVLAGDNSYSGGTVLQGGTLSVSSDRNLGSGDLTFAGGKLSTTASFSTTKDVDISQTASIEVARGKRLALNGDLTGSGGLTLVGDGTLSLGGTNSYRGLTTVDTGVLEGTVASVRGDIANSGTVVFGVERDGTFSGDIAAHNGRAGTMIKDGEGELTLVGRSALDWQIQEGGLKISADRFAGDIDIRDRATLSFANPSAANYRGTLSGEGSVNVNAGTNLQLSGDSSGFQGATFIKNANLSVDGKLGGDLDVADGARLSGSGTIGSGPQSVVTLDGGVLSAGDTSGAMTINGNLLVKRGSRLEIGHSSSPFQISGDLALENGSELSLTRSSARSISNAIIGGDLRLDGTLNVSDLGGFDAGVHRLFDYRGTLLDYGLEIGTTPAGVSRNDLFVQTSNAGQVSLLSSAGVDLTFWDGSAPALHDDGSIHGGAGVWNATNRGWTSSDGALNGPYRGQSFAIFGGTAGGRVMIDDTAGEIVTGGMQFLTNGYELAGDGLRLDGAAQRTVIRVGDGSIGSDAINATITSSLSGASSLVKSDDGVLVLAGDNSYSGGTVLQGGTLSVSSDRNLGSGDLTFAGGKLSTTASFSTTKDVDISQTASIEVARGKRLALNGDLTGSGGLTLVGDGTLSLGGTNSYRGLTTVDTGVLEGTVASVRGDIANSGTVVFGVERDGTFSGDIAAHNGRAGTMIKDGEGELTLVGRSALDWQIQEGGLKISADRFAGDIDIRDRATLSFANPSAANYRGTLSGEGSVNVNAGTNLQLSGDSSGFQGATFIKNANLSVDGKLGGDLDVADGARLSGSGTIGSGPQSVVTLDGGVLSAGDTSGAMTINGNLLVKRGSRLEIGSHPASSSHGAISTTGAIVIRGGAVAHFGANSQFKPFTKYQILTATKGVTGTFENVTSNYAFLQPRLLYGTNSVALTLSRNDVEFGAVGRTRNEAETGRAIETLGPGAELYDRFLVSEGDEARASLNSFSGEIHATALATMVNDSVLMRDVMRERVSKSRGLEVMGETKPVAYGLWSSGFKTTRSISGDGNAADAKETTTGSFFGFDSHLDNGVVIGAVGGYGETSLRLDDRSSNARLESYYLGFYAAGTYDDLKFSGGLAGTHHTLEMSRTARVLDLRDQLNARYSGFTAQAFAEVAYTQRLSETILEPYVNLAHVRSSRETFSEAAGPAAVSGEGAALNANLATFGIRGETSLIQRITLFGDMSWRHSFSDKAPMSRHQFDQSSPFEVQGRPLAADAFLASVGVNLNFSSAAAMTVAYGNVSSANSSESRFSASITGRF